MPSDSLPEENLSVTTFSQDGQTCSVFTPESYIKKFPWPEIIRDLRAGEGLDQRPSQAGRGGIFYFSGKRLPQPLVVRQYRHGGVWRFFSRARFFSPARFLTELRVHRRVAELGVPVPAAVAVIVLRKESRSVFVGGYFVTIRLQKSLTLPEFLESASGKIRLRIFFRLGGYLKKLHDNGIFYTDMHVKNILVTAAGEPWFIDFDKARELASPLSFRHRLANLKRFLRSLEKYRSRGGRLTESDQSAFLLAYAADSKSYAELFQKINRGLFWRRLVYRLGWLLNRS
jgi:3-deoxy-D-manno-octulosonic acid kinase